MMEDLTFWERYREYCKKHASSISSFVIFAFVGGLMTALYLRGHSLENAATLQERYMILCNAFTIPGVVILGIASLVLVSREGVFDGFAYTGYAIKSMFTRVKEHIRYGDFVLERREKRKEKQLPVLPIFAAGLIYAAVAAFYLIRFYH